MIDFDKLHEQLKLSKTSPTVIRAVKTLGEAFNSADISDEDLDEILSKFDKLARGHLLVEPEPDARWLSGAARTPGVGQTVRVPLTQYQDRRSTLNGRVGRVVAVRYGDVIVNTTDDGEPYEGLRFRPHELEIKIS